MLLTIGPAGGSFELPVEYLGAIERDSLRIAAVVSAWSVVTKLEGSELVVMPAAGAPAHIEVSITLTAARRGFGRDRFPEFTAAQKSRNDAFYESAHQP